MIKYKVCFSRGGTVSTDLFEADSYIFEEGFIVFLDKKETPVRIYSSAAFISGQPMK
jgi:hypothetical protein